MQKTKFKGANMISEYIIPILIFVLLVFGLFLVFLGGLVKLFVKYPQPHFYFFYIKAPSNQNFKKCFSNQQKNSPKIHRGGLFLELQYFYSIGGGYSFTAVVIALIISRTSLIARTTLPSYLATTLFTMSITFCFLM